MRRLLLSGRQQNAHAVGSASRATMTNLAAQGGALAAVAAASVLVARTGSAAVVGEYALLRVLPWLFGVVGSLGLPTSSAYFLASAQPADRRLRPTLAMLALSGTLVAVAAWAACAVPMQRIFFQHLRLQLVLIAAVLVATQLITVTAKACCQGSGDITGANVIIVAEELWFVIVYPAVLLAGGNHGITSVTFALIGSGLAATTTGLTRLWRNGFFAGWGRPSARLAVRVSVFGTRGQLGNMLWLTNLRFDFILLGALAGPAVLGIYAIASKFAELMRLVPTAANYVLYPRFARLGPAAATAECRRLLPRLAAVTVALTPVVAVASYIALPILYGAAYRGAILPAEIIIVGLSVEGAAAVASAYLLGCGKPGLNSLAMGTGATLTISLDVLLIPRLGALGGAITSAVTYLATTVMLTVQGRRLARRVTAAPHLTARRRRRRPRVLRTPTPSLLPRPDSAARRGVDCVVACIALLLAAPLILLIAVAVRLTSPGPAWYRQVRVGKSGRLFTMVKFRTMAVGADAVGPLVTDQADPRVTSLGAWLRATKLDELPQLLNVARGDMTLVGPRPEVPHFVSCYDEDELAVLQVRPGLTGAGQILYPEVPAARPAGPAGPGGQADPAEAAGAEERYVRWQLHPKLAADLDYLRRRGLPADLHIILCTLGLMARRRHLAVADPGVAVSPDAARP